MDILASYPQPHPTIAKSAPITLALYSNDVSQFFIFLRPICPADKIVITAAGYAQKSAHDRSDILLDADHLVRNRLFLLVSCMVE